MRYRITATIKTDKGRIRERNEDHGFAEVSQDEVALLIVADGMGGYRAGDLASKLAIETICAELTPIFSHPTSQPTIRLNSRTQDEDRSTVVLPETLESEHFGTFITQAIREAHGKIITYGQNHREARGLGSTVTLALVHRNRAYFGNVGDSRSYLFRNGELRIITRDHSLVAKLVEAGQIEPDDIYIHPKRNLIYRSLGSDLNTEGFEVDLFEEDLLSGDLILLCSDGLWEKLRIPELAAILSEQADLDAMCTQCIDLANKNGGEDNITIALARFEMIPDDSDLPIQQAIEDRDTGEISSVNPQ